MLRVLLLNNTNSKIPFKMFLLDLQVRGKWLAYNMHAKSLYHSKTNYTFLITKQHSKDRKCLIKMLD